MMKQFAGRHIVLIVCLLITAAPYTRTISHDFVWDDEEFVLSWETPRSITNVGAFIRGAVPEGHEGVYRPVRTFVYAASYLVWHEWAPGYHLQAILIHLINTALVFLILQLLIRNTLTTTIATLLFGLHPIHTESIAFVTASFDTAGFIWFFLSILLYVQYRRIPNLTLLAASLTSGLIAGLSNELTLSLPLVLYLIDRVFPSDSKLMKPWYAPHIFFTIPLVYAVLRFGMFAIPLRSDYVLGSPWLTFLTMTKVIVFYVRSLTLPFRLSAVPVLTPGIDSIIYDPQAVSSQSLTDPATLGGIGVVLFFLVLAIRSMKKAKLFSFGILWFFVTLLPVSNIFPAGTLFAERFLYLPAIGFSLMLSYILVQVLLPATKKLKLPWLFSFITGILLTSYAFRTTIRAGDWKNPQTFWAKTVAQNPDNPLLWNNLGLAYGQKGELTKAINAFEETLKRNPNEAKAHYNIGRTKLLINPKEATEPLATAFRLLPDIDLYGAKLAEAQLLTGAFDEALVTLSAIDTATPEVLTILNKAGGLAVKEKDHKQAIGIYREIIRLDPKQENAYNNLGAILIASKDASGAAQVLEQAILLNPEDFTMYYNLGTAYLENRELDKALEMFQKAKELNPFSTELDSLIETVYREKKESTKQ